MNKVKPFGYSVHLDLYGVRADLCVSLDFNYAALLEIASSIGMQVQSPPFLFVSPVPRTHEKAGLSGFLPLIESGISIHTLTNKSFITLDVYTCGEVDEIEVIEVAKRLYEPTGLETNYLVRGRDYHGAI